MKAPLHARESHGLRIDRLVNTQWFGLVEIFTRDERLVNCALSSTRRAQEHDGMAHIQQFLKLHDFGDKNIFRLETVFLGNLDGRFFQDFVDICRELQAREQVRDEPQEDLCGTTPSRGCLGSLTRRVDSHAAASTPSRRHGIASTPSRRPRQVQVHFSRRVRTHFVEAISICI